MIALCPWCSLHARPDCGLCGGEHVDSLGRRLYDTDSERAKEFWEIHDGVPIRIETEEKGEDNAL